ncbi:hypothetical protein FAP59_18935, partial [Morganella morganii]|nr:hypothetical protein [Morganella morganii]
TTIRSIQSDASQLSGKVDGNTEAIKLANNAFDEFRISNTKAIESARGKAVEDANKHTEERLSELAALGNGNAAQVLETVDKKIGEAKEVVNARTDTEIRKVTQRIDGLSKQTTASVKRIDEKTVTLNAAVEKLQAGSAETNQTLTTATGDIGGLKAAVNNVTTDMTTAQSDITGLKGSLSDLNTLTTANTGKLDKVAESVATLDSRTTETFGKVNQDITELKTAGNGFISAALADTESSLSKAIAAAESHAKTHADTEIGNLKTSADHSVSAALAASSSGLKTALETAKKEAITKAVQDAAGKTDIKIAGVNTAITELKESENANISKSLANENSVLSKAIAGVKTIATQDATTNAKDYARGYVDEQLKMLGALSGNPEEAKQYVMDNLNNVNAAIEGVKKDVQGIKTSEDTSISAALAAPGSALSTALRETEDRADKYADGKFEAVSADIGLVKEDISGIKTSADTSISAALAAPGSDLNKALKTTEKNAADVAAEYTDNALGSVKVNLGKVTADVEALTATTGADISETRKDISGLKAQVAKDILAAGKTAEGNATLAANAYTDRKVAQVSNVVKALDTLTTEGLAAADKSVKELRTETDARVSEMAQDISSIKTSSDTSISAALGSSQSDLSKALAGITAAADEKIGALRDSADYSVSAALKTQTSGLNTALSGVKTAAAEEAAANAKDYARGYVDKQIEMLRNLSGDPDEVKGAQQYVMDNLNGVSEAIEGVKKEVQGIKTSEDTSISAALLNSGSRLNKTLDDVKTLAREHTDNEVGKVSASVQTLTGDVNTAKNDITGLKGTVGTLESHLTAAGSNISELQTSVSKATGDIGGLRTEVDGLSATMAGADSKISGLRTDVNGLQDKVISLGTDITTAKDDAVSKATENARVYTDAQIRGLAELGSGPAQAKLYIDEQIGGVRTETTDQITQATTQAAEQFNHRIEEVREQATEAFGQQIESLHATINQNAQNTADDISQAMNRVATQGNVLGAVAPGSYAAGEDAKARGENSVALGANSRADNANEMNIGIWTRVPSETTPEKPVNPQFRSGTFAQGEYQQTGTRLLSGLSAGVKADDAVNKGQLDAELGNQDTRARGYAAEAQAAAEATATKTATAQANTAKAAAVSEANAYTNEEVSKSDARNLGLAQAVLDISTDYTGKYARQVESNAVIRSNNYTDLRVGELKQQMDENRKQANAGIAGVAAMANIPQVSPGSRFSVGAGLGNYGGQQGLAVGLSARIRENVVTKASASATSQGSFVSGVGVSYEW